MVETEGEKDHNEVWPAHDKFKYSDVVEGSYKPVRAQQANE